jgi:hypothetical protein
MVWLSIPIAVFLVWLILVVLFTPGINYHLSHRTSVHDPGFLYTIQSTCQAALHDGNRVDDYRCDVDNSDEITLARWRARPVWEKALGPFVWILERQQ